MKNYSLLVRVPWKLLFSAIGALEYHHIMNHIMGQKYIACEQTMVPS
jgi:hypothetical protein